VTPPSGRAGGRIGAVARQAATLVLVALGASSLDACSVLLDWSDYTGNADAAMGVSCGTNEQCAKALPSDSTWQGPIAFYPPQSTPPACGSVTSFYTLTGAAATCSACSCAAPTGGMCAQPLVTFYADSTCQTQCDQKALVSGTCVPPVCGTSFTIGESIAQGGSCVATGGSPSVPAATALGGTACLPAAPLSAATCGTGQLCLPTSPNPAAPRICVMSKGSATSCPGAPYKVGPEIYYTDPTQVTDTRGCSACSCGGPDGAACSFNPLQNLTNLRYDSMCQLPTVAPPFSIPTACQSLMNDGFQLNGTFRLQPGMCPATGGDPMGTATIPMGQATSICCTSTGP
jgi:hypothetical protein